MIFLTAGRDWILAHNRQELIDALLARIDPADEDHLLRLAAACLGCEEEDIVIVF